MGSWVAEEEGEGRRTRSCPLRYSATPLRPQGYQPSRSSTASSLGVTGPGRFASITAVSGSFRPCPVSVQTIEPSGRSSRYFRIPATLAVAARDESGGRIEAVTDDEILGAYRFLASREGVFCEPASAASVAGILKYRDDLPEGTIVCTLTGHGLKDPETAVIEA
ncbi:MAG: pyridoxal-phosphate dependent enzyme, partial [Actinomycetota bacterium]|nr:pyridoxal-phosphate dependent enzyme [Actinomycetota bacterium]